MSVVNELTSCKDGLCELQPVNDGVKAGFQNTDKIFGSITGASFSLFEILAQLLFRHIAIVAFKLLLGLQLHAVVGKLSLMLAVLTGAVISFFKRAFGDAPQIDAQAAIYLMFAL